MREAFEEGYHTKQKYDEMQLLAEQKEAEELKRKNDLKNAVDLVKKEIDGAYNFSLLEVVKDFDKRFSIFGTDIGKKEAIKLHALIEAKSKELKITSTSSDSENITDGADVHNSNKNVSNNHSAGICSGFLLIGTNDYKIVGKDWHISSRTVFAKYYPEFDRINKIIQNCLQGSQDIKKQNLCISTLPTQSDQEFYRGVLKGIAHADDSFAKGGSNLVRLNGEIICMGIN